MTRNIYDQLMAVLDKLSAKVDYAILQLNYIKFEEGIGFADENKDGYGLG